MQRPERSPHLLDEQRGLLPGREMPALGQPVIVNQLGVGPFRPTARGGIDLVWKGADGDGYGDAFRGEKRKVAFSIETR